MTDKKSHTVSADDSAIISKDELYRYLLFRYISEPNLTGILGYIMLNPSTADAFTDDQTILRCKRRAMRLGYYGIYVGNLYAYRTVDPQELKKTGYLVGPKNDHYIQVMASKCSRIIVGWGNHAQPERAKQVMELLTSSPAGIYHLGMNKTGQPKHPLYTGYNIKMVKI